MLKKIKSRFLYIFFILMAGIFSNEVFAIPPPDIVFRIDSRPPNIVFFAGFTSWGNERDLLHHVSGETVHSRTTAYISTTSNPTTIEQMARESLQEGVQAWIYAIRPGNNFYDINGSLIHANMQHPGTVVARQALGLYNRYAWQEEIAALNNISLEQIQYAQSVSRENDIITISPVHIVNQNYVPATPSINPGFLEVTEERVGDVYYYGDMELFPVMPAFGLDGCGPALNGGTNDVTCKKLSIEKVLSLSHSILAHQIISLGYSFTDDE